MDKNTFERNLLALSNNDPSLYSKLSSALTTKGLYRFIKARSGEIIPAITSSEGAALPLHSTVDPRREGERLIATLSNEGCLVFLGLGGAFAAETALTLNSAKKIIIVEYDCDGIAELLSSKDYIKLFSDPRVFLLFDPAPEELESFIVNNYLPALDGGIRVFPLRVRVDADKRFSFAADAVKDAIDKVSMDYSVQAYFGKRWFTNIIRNIFLAEKQTASIMPIRKALICAAGPSLEENFHEIKMQQTVHKKDLMVIAADTSLPALLHAGIEPDAVISIDCQHISYQHLFTKVPEKTLLFLDLASPPSIASRSENRVFFSGRHPFSLYINRYWRPLPLLDTSGANVTHAALSLAENLGAREITLYGADFSYPMGKTYARGAYIYPFFEKIQSRLVPLEAHHSGFLYRDHSLKKIIKNPGIWYYETKSLVFYREKAAEKTKNIAESQYRERSFFSSGKARLGAFDFLREYFNSISELSSFNPVLQNEPLSTLLPLAAFFRRINPSYNSEELFNAVKSCCLEELKKIIRI